MSLQLLKQVFDLKSAVIGSALMSIIVGLVNAGHGLTPALTAAGKQALYTFFVAGFIMQLCRWLAGRDLPPVKAIFSATLLPTLLTVFLVYNLHSLKGTPEPLWSTLPVAVICLVSFFLVSRAVVAEQADAAAERLSLKGVKDYF